MGGVPQTNWKKTRMKEAGMRKTARLDQILLRLGYTDQDQITRALARQRARGGRLGRCLVENRSISAKQLLAALSEQYQLPSSVPSAKDVPPALLQKIPRELVFDSLILPLDWNAEREILTLAVGSPDDGRAIDKVKEIFGARAVRLELAPDTKLMEISSRLLGSTGDSEDERSVELPELSSEEEEEEEAETEILAEDDAVVERVLMVSERASSGDSLIPLFRREGVDLTVASGAREAANALAATEFNRILLAEEMVGTFSAWIKRKEIPKPGGEIVVFRSVSGALLENPLPYEATVRSLKAAVEALADSRCSIQGSSPPYGLIASDLEALAQRVQLRRIVVDGLQLAAHLLLPGQLPPGKDPVGHSQPFDSFASTLELATRIRFPWRIDRLLDGCHALFSGRKAKAGTGSAGREMRLAAQLLALVWYRHNHIPGARGDAEGAMAALRDSIRKKAGRLAPLEVVEAYLRLIADRGGALAGAVDRQVLLVGGDRTSKALTPELKGAGCQTVFTEELADALTFAERRPPGAILLDEQTFATQVDQFARVVKLDGRSQLFVLTDSTDPSLVLKLLDLGVDDVFGPPHDFELVAARINRAIRSRANQRPSPNVKGGHFSATFETFPFLELIDTLGHGRKTARIELAGGDGETGTIFLKKGQIVFAATGKIRGEPAVHHMISWEETGDFTVHAETKLPDRNVEAPTDSILEEGRRLLDESSGTK